MTSPFRNRRRAEALQRALERYGRLLDQGADSGVARAQAGSGLSKDDIALLVIAAQLPEAAAPIPEPEFAEMFAARLRHAQVGPVTPLERAEAVGRTMRSRRRPAFGLAAVAAGIAIFAGLLVPAFRSLPGDPLYALKRASERTEVVFASGPTEARLRIDIAKERFAEVHRLVERAHMSALGPGLAAAGATEGIDDPHLAQLISDTLESAGEELASAAQILISTPADAQDLDSLVAITQRGKQLAENVAADLPLSAQPPAFDTVVQFAKIEAQAKAARSNVTIVPALQPCETPTPTPTVTPDQSPVTEPTPTETPTASPTVSPEATPTPTGTPCISPTPSPTPVPTPTPATTPAEDPTTSPSDQGSSASDGTVQPADQDQTDTDQQSADSQPTDGQPSA